MTQGTAHMHLDERAVAEACQAAAIEMARQVGVTLTPAGYRQGAADRPVEQSQMVEYMKAAIRAYLQTAAADVSGLVERLRRAHLEYADGVPVGYGDPVNPDGPEAASTLQTLSASNAALEAEIERLRGDRDKWKASAEGWQKIAAPKADAFGTRELLHDAMDRFARTEAALSAPKGGQDE